MPDNDFRKSYAFRTDEGVEIRFEEVLDRSKLRMTVEATIDETITTLLSYEQVRFLGTLPYELEVKETESQEPQEPIPETRPIGDADEIPY